MDTGRAFVCATVAFIATAVLVSGVLVPATGGGQVAAAKGSGAVDVTMQGLGDGPVEIVAGDFGSGGYTLRVPDAVLLVESATGRPAITYGVQIPALGYGASTTAFLTPEDAGVLRLSVEQGVLTEDRVTKEEYRVILYVRTVGDAGIETIYRETFTVEVQDA